MGLAISGTNCDASPTPSAALHGCARRLRRMRVLLVTIVVLSLADLILTAAHLQLIGMVEANPIAAYVIRGTNSLWALSLYKASTVSVCVLALYRLRQHRAGEFAAWTSTMILVALCFHWRAYADQIDMDEHARLADLATVDDQWLRLRALD